MGYTKHKSLTGEHLHQPFKIGNGDPTGSPVSGDWYFDTNNNKLYKCAVNGVWEPIIDDASTSATDLWSAQKIDSELDDIATISGTLDDHNHFNNLDGGTSGEYYHLTFSEHTALTSGDDCTIHKHDDRYYTEVETDGLLTTLSGNISQEIDDDIAALIDSSPELLDTLNELAAAMGDDANFATTIINLITTTSGNLSSEIDNDISTHSSSGDHDGRYYTEVEVDDLFTTLSGVIDLAVAATRICNTTGATLTKGTAVTICGLSGVLCCVCKSDNREFTKMPVCGVVDTDIANEAEGNMIRIGKIDLDTSGMAGSEGDRLYVQGDGSLDTIIPISGGVQRVGFLIAKAEAGSICICIRGRSSIYAAKDEHPVLRMGNDVGHTKVSFKTYTNNEIATMDNSGNLTLSGTVDGVDVAIFKSDYDGHTHDDRYYTESEADSLHTTLSGNLQTNIDSKDNYTSWSFAVDGATKDAITSGNVLDFVGGDNITITRSAEDQITISGSAGEIDHGALTGLGDDDHPQYVPTDASRGFTATVSGVTPTEDYHLATKSYVDTQQTGIVKSGSQTISSGTNTVSVNFGSPFDDVSYVVSASIRNTIDSPSEQYSWTLTTKATTGFTFTLSAVVDTANFYLEWVAGGSAAGNYVESNETILTTSGTWKGRTLQIIVDDASVVFGDALYCALDFHYERCDADSESTMPCAFIACGNGTGTMEGLYDGQICSTDWNWSAGYVYVSTTTGKLTQTTVSGSGDINQTIGRALSADTILVNTTYDMVEV